MPMRFPAGNAPVPVFISADENDGSAVQLAQSLAAELNGKDEKVHFNVVSLDLQPGDLVRQRTAELLEEAQIVIFLVTPKFFAAPLQNEQAAVAMRRSEEGKATVVPVLFTDQKTEGTPFANVEPLRLAGDWSKVQELSQPMGSEIHLALVKLVQSRREDRAVEHKGQKRPAPTGLHFRVVWLWVAGLTGLLAIGILAWFSGNPAGHRILYKEPSPLTFFLKSCVIGFAAMSLLQIGRRLFPMRGSFHKELTVEWLGDAAVAELYTAVGAERIRNMFDLPSELLTGQLGAIADQVMEKQGRSEQPTLLIRRMAAEEENVVQPPATSSEQDPRVRAAMAIQRNLDQFQISTSALWRRYLLMTSILLSMTLFLFGLRLFDGGSFIPGLTSIPQHGPALTARQYSENFSLLCLATVLTALFGGFLGSIARDLVAIVEKLRR